MNSLKFKNGQVDVNYIFGKMKEKKRNIYSEISRQKRGL